MTKRILIAILFIYLILLTSCSNANLNTQKEFTFSVLYNQKESAPYKNDWAILDEYKKLKHANIDVLLGDDADFESSIEKYIYSDNAPDVILKCWPDTIEDYVNEGILLPISDFEDQMPYYMKYIKDNNLEEEIDKLRMENGKYYLLTGYKRETQVQQWIYRKDLFDKHNLKTPENYDELFESLVLLKEIYEESTPITASWGGAHLFSMIGANYGIPAGWSGDRYYDYEQDKWFYAPATENFKKMHEFLNRCYSARVLDPAFVDQSDIDFMSKIKDGRAIVTVTWITSGLDVWDDELRENGIENADWEPLPVMESTIGIKALPPVDRYQKGLAIMADVEDKPYFNRLLQFLDWAVYSKEGNELTVWGIEGLTYKNTDSGKVFLPEIITPKNKNGTIDIVSKYGFNTILDLVENEEFEDYKKPDDIVEFLERSEKNQETLKVPPSLVISIDDQKIIDSIYEKIQKYVEETKIKFITGEMSIEEEWDDYLENLENMGYKVIEKIWNNSFDEMR